MKILRQILGVIAGYIIFAGSAVLLFKLSGIDPHANPSISFMIITVVYGACFSFLGGLVTQLISRSGTLTINCILAALMASFAAFSMFKSSGNHYSQLAAIVVFAPASLLGGLIYVRKIKRGL